MSASAVSPGKPAVPQKDRHGRWRSLPRPGHSILSAKELKMHRDLIIEGKPMSGRSGGYLYYWAHRRLCWRVHVIPKDPRTVAQQRSRTAFGAASKAWSESQQLTNERRNAWSAEAAKIQCNPRLGLSGSRTAQQHFVGRNSVKDRWGLPLLWEPQVAERRKEDPAGWDLGSAPEVSSLQRLALAPSGRLHVAPGPLPEQYQWQARPTSRIGGTAHARPSPALARPPRTKCLRQVWRGG